jgi:hypothetical protein
MKILAACILATLIDSSLMANTIYTVPDLPAGDTDTLSIQLDPANGGLDGIAGASVGWGFNVTWTSTEGDWISFTSTSLGSVEQAETNPSLLASYTDFVGAQGGPVDFGLSPGSWTETFDGVSQGVGLYQITADPSIAVPSAEDTGQITFNFQVYNGDPLSASQIGDGSYSYYGSSTAFSVTVDASSTPEPSTWLLVTLGLIALAYYRVRVYRTSYLRPGFVGPKRGAPTDDSCSLVR